MMTDPEPNFLGLFAGERNPVTLKAGDVLFKKGDAAHAMYVVLSGEVRIGDGNIVLENVSPGGIVGEMALIDHSARSATVTAISPATLAEVDEKRFLFMVRETPSFALNVLRLLTGRLRRTSPRIGA